jgi:hypothetical protein
MIGVVFSSIVNAIWAWWDTLGRCMLIPKTNNPVICFYSLSMDKRGFAVVGGINDT